MVLRWGHRPKRDARLTTHVALAARALGADGVILSDREDPKIEETLRKVAQNWGGSFFFEMRTAWKEAIRRWRMKGGLVVHLTVYGENIETSDVLKRVKSSGKDILIIVGSKKTPDRFFAENVSDFNIAIGNQPHSECASVAIFLDRFFEGKELARRFKDAKLRIMPQKRGKRVVSMKPRAID